MKTAKKTSGNTNTTGKTFTAEERTAMQERARELATSKNDGEKALIEKIAQMPEPDRSLANRVHSIIKESAPSLTSKTWYGMPAYANRDGKVVCFFQPAFKFKYRYSTLGFQDAANLDEGNVWPVVFALKKLTPTDEAKIKALVKKAVS